MTHVPKVWRFVSIASSVVGFVCLGLSSSLPCLIGKWIWWKIFLYVIFSIFIIIYLNRLLAKERQRRTSPWNRAHFAYLFLIITSVYSFFWDKVVKVKPDAYSLISSAGFALMSLSLERQTHCGVEADLLSFFSATLTAQLMKIHIYLLSVGAGFCYALLILRSYFDKSADHFELLPVQNSLVAEDLKETMSISESKLARSPYEP